MGQRTNQAGSDNEVLGGTVTFCRLAWFGVMLGVYMMTGCTTPEPPSPIAQKLEAAGAGDLKNTSADAIQQWLGPRRNLAIDVEEMCKPARAKATAQWAETTEGRICAASSQLAFYRYTPQQGDGKTYKSGTR
jgi:hypothetical protein